MAVTVTAVALTNALRVGDTAEELAEVERLLAFASVAVERHLGDAFATTPDAIANEAVVRYCGYLFDQPLAGRGSGFADALRNSGAQQILTSWRVKRAGSTAEGSETTTTGNGSNPVTAVAVVGDDLLVTFADGSTSTEALPADDDDDETARAAAAAAQASADAAQTTADAAGLTAGGSEVVTVAVADEWVATVLDYPGSTIFGVKVNGAPIELGVTADLPDAGVVAGADASAAVGTHLYALGAATAGGVLFFASSTAGTFDVRIYEHG